MKQICIRIHKNGAIDAETDGVKGKACLDYIRVIEQLTHARTEDSDYKPDYFETDEAVEETAAEEVTVR